MLHCQNCGISLAPGTMKCPNCGAFVSQPSPPASNQGSSNPPSWGGQEPPGGYNPSSWGGQEPPGRHNPPSWGGRTQVEGGVGAKGPDAPVAPWEVSPSPLLNAGQPSNAGQPWNAQPQQPPTYANASAPFSPQASPPMFSPPAQLGVSRRMFLTIITLAVLVILSGIALVFYTEVARPAQLSANATATVQALSTTSVMSTATANVHATGTARVAATAGAKATVQAKATATAIQGVYTDATSGSPVFGSSLSFPDDGNWDVNNAVGGGGCAFTDGALHSTIMKKSFYLPCFAKATNFDNFALQAEITIVKGDEGGLIFRGNDKTSKFYYFRVGRDGFYSLNLSKDEKNSTPLIYDTSPSIKKKAGEQNILTVIARGKDIYLFINKQFVASTIDGSYSAGEIGVFAGNNGNETDVAFSNVRVWDL